MSRPSSFEEEGQRNDAMPGAAEDNTEMRILSIGVQPPKLNVLPMKETFLMKLKSFFSREKKETVLPRPVQTEWPMDRIVVVRNDLSDSDYELVWSESPKDAKGQPKPKGEQLVGRAWKKVNPFAKKQKEQKAESVEV
jgi:hypothetical protein